MPYSNELADVRIRLASARAARDGWRGSARQEKYLEAYFLVESLEAELEVRSAALQQLWRRNRWSSKPG